MLVPCTLPRYCRKQKFLFGFDYCLFFPHSFPILLFFLLQELVIMGAPGSYYWTGTVKVLNLTDNTYYKLNDDAVIARRYTYLGKQLSVLAVRVD